jgi:DNA-binding CsgD family transcriptional regulator
MPPGLTVREREVAELAASGMPSKQIARTLFISKRTVDTHLRHVYAKTGTGSRVRARELGQGQPRSCQVCEDMSRCAAALAASAVREIATPAVWPRIRHRAARF